MRKSWFLITGLLSVPAVAQDGSGLKISAAVDLAGAYNVDSKSTAEDSFTAREAEILLTAPIDQSFDAALSFAAHREEGKMLAELHEAVISSSRLIPRSNIRLGQFYLGLGRLNRFHRHEWGLVSAPKVQAEFFGEEGALDSGLEYSLLAPVPFYLETTLGVTNGFTYGEADEEGKKPRKPTHYARIATYVTLPGQGGAQTALNYLSRTDAAATRMTLTGFDLTAKWREAGVLNFLLQSEVWHRQLEPKDKPSESAIGAYVLPQYALDSQLFFGLLVEYFSVLNLRNEAGEKLKNKQIGLVPTLSYKASEFSTLRLAYNHAVYQRDDQSDHTERRLELQANYIIGAHPAHDF